MSRQLDGQRRERDFHAATHALDWHRAEQLAVAALQDRDLTDAERDVWRERRAAAVEGLLVVAEQLELLFDAPSEAPGRHYQHGGCVHPVYNKVASQFTWNSWHQRDVLRWGNDCRVGCFCAAPIPGRRPGLTSRCRLADGARGLVPRCAQVLRIDGATGADRDGSDQAVDQPPYCLVFTAAARVGRLPA